MWIKVMSEIDTSPYFVNMDKVRYADVFNRINGFSIRAYLDDDGSKAVDLFWGTRDECLAYMEWLQSQLDVNYDIAEYHKPPDETYIGMLKS